jgi:hypothetical protein
MGAPVARRWRRYSRLHWSLQWALGLVFRNGSEEAPDDSARWLRFDTPLTMQAVAGLKLRELPTLEVMSQTASDTILMHVFATLVRLMECEHESFSTATRRVEADPVSTPVARRASIFCEPSYGPANSYANGCRLRSPCACLCFAVKFKRLPRGAPEKHEQYALSRPFQSIEWNHSFRFHVWVKHRRCEPDVIERSRTAPRWMGTRVSLSQTSARYRVILVRAFNASQKGTGIA